jgi:hypothetical protein
VTGRASAINAGREVEVRAPGGQVFRFRIADDDTAVLLIDGRPAVGIDFDGAGHWRDGEVWERLGGGTVTDRYVVVRDMTAGQFHGLASHLGCSYQPVLVPLSSRIWPHLAGGAPQGSSTPELRTSPLRCRT